MYDMYEVCVRKDLLSSVEWTIVHSTEDGVTEHMEGDYIVFRSTQPFTIFIMETGERFIALPV